MSDETSPDASVEAAETPVTPEPKIYKVKIDGAEEEVDDATLLREYSKFKASDKRFQVAAQKEREVQEFWKALDHDLTGVLEGKFGEKFREKAEEYVLKKLQEDELSPEQKERRRLESELEKYRKAEKDREEQKRQQEYTAEQQRYAAELDAKFSKALDSSGLPKTRDTVRRMALVERAAMAVGYDIPADELVQKVKASYKAEYDEIYGNLEGDKLLDALGPELLRKIRAADLAKTRKTTEKASYSAPQPTKGRQAPPKRSAGGEEYLSVDEGIARLYKKLGISG